VLGLGTSLFWPSTSVLLAGLTPHGKRHTAFALQRVAVNAGVGLGGLVGGLIATTSDATSFTVLFLLDVATYLAMIAVLPFVADPEPRRRTRSWQAGTATSCAIARSSRSWR
jgi:MFS family permease